MPDVSILQIIGLQLSFSNDLGVGVIWSGLRNDVTVLGYSGKIIRV